VIALTVTTSAIEAMPAGGGAITTDVSRRT
jgi:hypothetical protein